MWKTIGDILATLLKNAPYIVAAIRVWGEYRKANKRAEDSTDAYRTEMFKRTESERIVGNMLAQSSDPAERLRIYIAEARARKAAGK